MANLKAIHSVGSSLVVALRNGFPPELAQAAACSFRLLSSGEFNDLAGEQGPLVSVYLHRITHNEQSRSVRATNSASDARPPLSLNLHYLLTIWSSSALVEHWIAAWLMHYLHTHPLLDRSALSPEAGWAASELVQLVPAELTPDEMFRLWEAFAPKYRLSLSYVARVVRIEPDPQLGGAPVVATRFDYAASALDVRDGGRL